MGRRNNNVLQGIRVGQTITADFLNRMRDAINTNTAAVNAPTQKDVFESPLDPGGATDSVWNAGAADITDATVTLTDSNGDTTDIEQITTIVFTNSQTGARMTLNITYT